jgi:hypothetical protein
MAAKHRIDETLWFYNLDNGRPDPTVNHELSLILAMSNPLVVVGAEGVGLGAAHDPGYTLVRDVSTKSRANILAYVRKDAEFAFGRWLDMEGTWPRTEFDGIHEPRSFPVFWVNGVQIAGVHLPPVNAHPRVPLQTESLDSLTRALGPWNRGGWDDRSATSQAAAIARPRIAIGDFNGRRGDPDPSPDTLARALNGRTVGDRIDCAVVTGDVEVRGFEYVDKVGPPQRRASLGSDHGHAYRLDVSLPVAEPTGGGRPRD